MFVSNTTPLQKKIWLSLFFLHALLYVLFELFGHGYYAYLFYLRLFLIRSLLVLHISVFIVGFFAKQRLVLVIVQGIILTTTVVYYLFSHSNGW
jgi:hypothetical protein